MTSAIGWTHKQSCNHTANHPPDESQLLIHTDHRSPTCIPHTQADLLTDRLRTIWRIQYWPIYGSIRWYCHGLYFYRVSYSIPILLRHLDTYECGHPNCYYTSRLVLYIYWKMNTLYQYRCWYWYQQDSIISGSRKLARYRSNPTHRGANIQVYTINDAHGTVHRQQKTYMSITGTRANQLHTVFFVRYKLDSINLAECSIDDRAPT